MDAHDPDPVDLYLLAPRLWRETFAREIDPNDPASLARFVEVVGKLLRCFEERLPELGLSLARLAELRDAAWYDEDAASGRRWDKLDWDQILDQPLSRGMVTAIENLLLRGANTKEISCLLSVPLKWVVVTVARTRLRPNHYQVARAHLGGLALNEITKKTGEPRTSAERIIRERLGEEPKVNSREEVRDRRERVRQLRFVERLSESDIAEKLDVPLYTVKNDLRDRRRRRGPAQ